MPKKETVTVQGTEIALLTHRQDDYISLTDMARYRDDYHIRGIKKSNSFDLTGNSNGIEFSAYDKEAAIEDIAAKLKRKEAEQAQQA